MSLQPGSLYISLFARATPYDYHWALYHHTQATRGTKWHIRNISDTWMADHQVISDAPKQFLLMGFLRIAMIPSERAEQLDELVRGVPYTAEGTTCRTWVMEAVHRLVDAGIVRCGRLETLEQEAKRFGFTQFDDTENNVQPRPAADSVNCVL